MLHYCVKKIISGLGSGPKRLFLIQIHNTVLRCYQDKSRQNEKHCCGSGSARIRIGFGCPGSESVPGMRIRIQEHGS
jgi:hypothetical protein